MSGRHALPRLWPWPQATALDLAALVNAARNGDDDGLAWVIATMDPPAMEAAVDESARLLASLMEHYVEGGVDTWLRAWRTRDEAGGAISW